MSKVYGLEVTEVTYRILHHPGRENNYANAISRSPYSPVPTCRIAELEILVASVITTTMSKRLEKDPVSNVELELISEEWQKCTWIC